MTPEGTSRCRLNVRVVRIAARLSSTTCETYRSPFDDGFDTTSSGVRFMNGRHASLLIAAALAVASLLVGGTAPALADQRHGTGKGTTTEDPFQYLEVGEHT